MKIPRTIYAMRHDPTGKIYVGSSSRLKHRLRQHLTMLKARKHSNEAMQADYDTFGGDYTFFKLEEITRYDDRVREYVWMDLLQTRNPAKGYNFKDKSSSFDLNACEKIQIHVGA